MSEDILFSQNGQLGIISLNRAKALNALTLDMILALQRQLTAWQEDDSVRAIVLQSNSGNAFCAGGDIRSLYEAGRLNGSGQMQFFWHEYRLNHFIHHYPKPYISLIDGMVMGGGVGISLHGSHAIATENFVFSMPETGIGFFPDIGASYLLTRCPGFSGLYLGLTGNRVGATDALNAGLVKQIISAERLSALLASLQDVDMSQDAFKAVDACLHEHRLKDDLRQPSQFKPAIDHCFVQPSIEGIFSALEQEGSVWATSIENSLSQKSPLSLKVTFAQLQQAKGLSLADCLQMDYNLVSHFIKGSDFYEGVRALIIDKDKQPKWNPASLDQVSEEMVAKYFTRIHPALEWVS